MSSRSSGAGPATASGSPDTRLGRLRRALAGSLLRNGLYIMGTTAVTSLLGFGFWLISAHLLPAADVGRAASLVSAMLFVAVITNLGLGQVLISRLGARTPGYEWSLTVNTALLAAALVSLAGGLIAGALVPLLIPSLRGDLGAATLLVLPLGVASIACSQVLDFACIAERQARPSFLRNSAAALLRLSLIAVVALASGESEIWLPAIWVLSFLAIDLHGVVWMLPGLGRSYLPTLDGWRRELADLRHLIAGHQAINLGSQAPAYLLPVLVSARLGPTEGAYFYAAFMLATGLYFIAPAIGNSLFAEGAKHPERLRADLGRAARYIALLATPPAVVLVAAAPLLLGFFGGDYADAGTDLLYVLVATALLDAPYQLVLATLRARSHLRDAAAATWVLLVTCVAATWLLLPPLGLVGAGVGWGIGKGCGLLVGLLAVWRPARDGSKIE
jgi:O-antigen/teichoic acid export membrane protein